MPRTQNPRKGAADGMGQGWTVVIDLLTAIGVWAGIGFGLDYAFHTGPVLMASGMVLGATAGIYIIYRRALDASGQRKGVPKPGAGVTRRGEKWPAIGDAGAVGDSSRLRPRETDDDDEWGRR